MNERRAAMRHAGPNWLIAATLFASLVGCRPDYSDAKIVGKWAGQFTAGRVDEIAKGAEQLFRGPNVGTEAKKFLAESRVQREYRPDGTMTMTAVDQAIDGTWQPLGGDKYRWTWRGDSPIDVTVLFDGPDSFSELDSDGHESLRFEREKPGS